MTLKRLAIVMVLLLAFSMPAAAADAVKWFSLKEGTAKAKAEKKPLVVDFFFGEGCPRCVFLEKEVYSNTAIAKKLNDDFVPIRIDLTKDLTRDEEDLGNRFSYKKDCMLLFLDPEGNIVKDTKGKDLCFIDKVDPEWFIGYLDQVKTKSSR